MAVFTYKAIDLDRASVRGTVVADTPRAARDQLRGRGLTVEDLLPLAAGQAAHWHGLRRLPLLRRLQRPGRAHGRDITAFVRELSTLLAVGIPVLEALETLGRQQPRRFKPILQSLHDRIAGGGSLAEAMAEQPAVFDELCLNIVEVGESAGTLDESLARLASFRERAAQLKGKIVTALFYPAIVLTMSVAVSLFLMSYVVPKLLEGLIDAGQPVPLATRLVKGASDGLLSWWWLILMLAVGLTALVSLVLRTPAGRLAWHRLQLRLPIVGEMARKQAIVRIAIVVATLLKSDVVFLQAIRIAGKSTKNRVIRQALERVEAAVESGRDIAAALEQTRVFPPTVVQVFAVGEQSGRLEEMLDRLASDYDAQVATMSQRLAAVLEPVLIIVMVVLVGLIAFATVLPMLEAGNVL